MLLQLQMPRSVFTCQQTRYKPSFTCRIKVDCRWWEPAELSRITGLVFSKLFCTVGFQCAARVNRALIYSIMGNNLFRERVTVHLVEGIEFVHYAFLGFTDSIRDNPFIPLLNVTEAIPLCHSPHALFTMFGAEMWPDRWNDPPAQLGRPWIMPAGNSNKMKNAKKKKKKSKVL